MNIPALHPKTKPGLHIILEGPNTSRVSDLHWSLAHFHGLIDGVSLDRIPREGSTTIRLNGPSGCGKSQIARWIAQELNSHGERVWISESGEKLQDGNNERMYSWEKIPAHTVLVYVEQN